MTVEELGLEQVGWWGEDGDYSTVCNFNDTYGLVVWGRGTYSADDYRYSLVKKVAPDQLVELETNFVPDVWPEADMGMSLKINDNQIAVVWEDVPDGGKYYRTEVLTTVVFTLVGETVQASPRLTIIHEYDDAPPDADWQASLSFWGFPVRVSDTSFAVLHGWSTGYSTDQGYGNLNPEGSSGGYYFSEIWASIIDVVDGDPVLGQYQQRLIRIPAKDYYNWAWIHDAIQIGSHGWCAVALGTNYIGDVEYPNYLISLNLESFSSGDVRRVSNTGNIISGNDIGFPQMMGILSLGGDIGVCVEIEQLDDTHSGYDQWPFWHAFHINPTNGLLAISPVVDREWATSTGGEFPGYDYSVQTEYYNNLYRPNESHGTDNAIIWFNDTFNYQLEPWEFSATDGLITLDAPELFQDYDSWFRVLPLGVSGFILGFSYRDYDTNLIGYYQYSPTPAEEVGDEVAGAACIKVPESISFSDILIDAHLKDSLLEVSKVGTIPIYMAGVGSIASSASSELISVSDFDGAVGSSADSASAEIDIIPPKVIAALFYGPTSGVVRWREVIESSSGDLSMGTEQTVSAPTSISQIDTYMVDSIGEGYFRFAAVDFDGNTSVASVSNMQRDDTVNWTDVPFLTKQARAIDRAGVQGGGPICSSENYEMYSGIVNDGTDTSIDIAYRQKGTNDAWSHMTVPAGAAVLWVGGMTAFPGTDHVLLMYGVGAEYSWNKYNLDSAVATTLRVRCVDVSSGNWGAELILDSAARIGIYSPAGNSVVATTSTLACLLYYNSASPYNSYSQSVPLTRSGVELTAGTYQSVSYSTDYSGSWEKAVRVDDKTVLTTYVTNNNDSHTSHVISLRYDGSIWGQVSDVSLRGSMDNQRVSSITLLESGLWMMSETRGNTGTLRTFRINDDATLVQEDSISISLGFAPWFMKCVARGQ